MSDDPNDFDYAETLKAKSDQLNAQDLVAGPITVQITGASRGNAEQPVVYKISGGHMPWKVSKGMRRMMGAIAQSTRTGPWLGKWVQLYNEASVDYGKENTGGVRICAVDDRLLPKTETYSVRDSHNKIMRFEVKPLRENQRHNKGAATANMDALLADNELTRDDVDRWLRAEGKPPLDDAPDKVPALAAWLAADTSRLDAIRALIPNEADEPETEADDGDVPDGVL